MKRLIIVCIGSFTWTVLNALLGNTYDPVMALLSAFVVAWCMEGNDK